MSEDSTRILRPWQEYEHQTVRVHSVTPLDELDDLTLLNKINAELKKYEKEGWQIGDTLRGKRGLLIILKRPKAGHNYLKRQIAEAMEEEP